MSHTAIVPDHVTLRNYLLQHRLPLYFLKPVLAQIETYMTAATAEGFRGKVVDLAEYSNCHRTTLGHIPAQGKWDEGVLQTKVKAESLRHVMQASIRTAEPMFVIHNDTIAQKTKPSSQAEAPIIIHIYLAKSCGATRLKLLLWNVQTYHSSIRLIFMTKRRPRLMAPSIQR